MTAARTEEAAQNTATEDGDGLTVAPSGRAVLLPGMHFDINAAPAEIPAFLSRLTQIGGVAAWRQREQDFAHKLRENPMIAHYLASEFAIEQAMFSVQRYRASTGRLPSMTPELVRLYGFAGMVARVYQRLSVAARSRLATRMVGALKDDVGLAPIAFEMRTVEHFMKAGFDVEFYDLCNNGGWDFVMRKDGIAIDVECKAISGDIGRKVHLLTQHQLGRQLYPSMGGAEKPGSVRFVVATVPDRLFPRREFLLSVADAVKQALSDGKDTRAENVCAVTYREAPLQGSPFDFDGPAHITDDALIEFCWRAFGENVRHLLTTFTPRRSAIVVAVRSAKPDTLLRTVLRQLKEGARQLSRARPGCLCVQFRRLTSVELRDLAGSPLQNGEPTGIQLITNEFFKGEGRDHVHTVAYTAPGNFVTRTYRTADRHVTETREDGASYVFTNKRHPANGDPRYSVFR